MAYIPPWLDGTPLGDIYNTVYDETGDPVAAMEAVRADSNYDIYFAGNRRDDGTVRYSEAEYLSNMESYEDSLVAVGLDRTFVQQYFTDDFVKLIEGNVDGAEFWTQRVKPLWDFVTTRSDEIRAEYAGFMGLESMTDEAIFASVLNPEKVWTGLIDQAISMSEIRGAYRERFANIDVMDPEYFEGLYERGDIGLNEARALFANADAVIPTIQVLAQRHNDPDDDFDIYEFTEAAVWNDPAQASRIRRLVASERAMFQQASSQVDVLRNNLTGAVGLEER